MAEKIIFCLILIYLAQILATNFFFFKNLAPSVTSYHGQLLSCTLSEKTNDLILRKLSGGRTDGQTDESDFIGRCPTNIHISKNPAVNDDSAYYTSNNACFLNNYFHGNLSPTLFIFYRKMFDKHFHLL